MVFDLYRHCCSALLRRANARPSDFPSFRPSADRHAWRNLNKIRSVRRQAALVGMTIGFSRHYCSVALRRANARPKRSVVEKSQIYATHTITNNKVKKLPQIRGSFLFIMYIIIEIFLKALFFAFIFLFRSRLTRAGLSPERGCKCRVYAEF